MMNSQRSDTEQITWLKKVKNVGIDEIVKQNEISNKNLKSQI